MHFGCLLMFGCFSLRYTCPIYLQTGKVNEQSEVTWQCRVEFDVSFEVCLKKMVGKHLLTTGVLVWNRPNLRWFLHVHRVETPNEAFFVTWKGTIGATGERSASAH